MYCLVGCQAIFTAKNLLTFRRSRSVSIPYFYRNFGESVALHKPVFRSAQRSNLAWNIDRHCIPFSLTNSTEQSPSWEANRFSASQENSLHFMEPEGSLPHSQVSVTCPYPEPARSSPYPHIPLPEDPSQYYPPIYARFFRVVSFPQVSPSKPCIYLYFPPYVLYATPISFF